MGLGARAEHQCWPLGVWGRGASPCPGSQNIQPPALGYSDGCWVTQARVPGASCRGPMARTGARAQGHISRAPGIPALTGWGSCLSCSEFVVFDLAALPVPGRCAQYPQAPRVKAGALCFWAPWGHSPRQCPPSLGHCCWIDEYKHGASAGSAISARSSSFKSWVYYLIYV